MKSDRKKRILAAILCMVMVLSGNISALAEGEVYADPDAVTQMETPEAVSETQPESAPQEPAAEEPPVSTEPAAPEAPAENSEPAAPEAPAENNEPAAPETPAENNEPAAPETPAENNEPAAPETPEAPAEENPVFSEETELTKELRDASGKLVQKVTAKLPKGAFEAETSQIEMEVTYVDSSMENYIKGMMEKKLPTDNTLGDYFLYNIQFKVNGEAKESLEPITITFENSNLEIKDTKKANVFFFDPANPEVSGDKDELVEITQRSELLESLQAAGQSTATMEEDYDLSSIEIKEENRSGKIVLEGRKSTIYGCYVEKEPEEKPEQPEEKPADIPVLNYEDDKVTVSVTAEEAGIIPEGAELKVLPITSEDTDTKEQYQEVEKKIQEKVAEEEKEVAGFLAYDITFVDKDGNEMEPNGKVKVSMNYKKAELPQEVVENKATDAEVTVLHLEEDENGEVKQVVDMGAEQKANVDTLTTTEGAKVQNVEVETESFSVFTITWTYGVVESRQIFTINVHYVDRDGNEIDVKNKPVKITLEENQEIELKNYWKEPVDSRYSKSNEIRVDSITGDSIVSLQTSSEGNHLKTYFVKYKGNGESYFEWLQSGWGNKHEGDIYFIYKKDSTSGGGSVATENLAHRKYVTDNKNGTYDLTLDVKGAVGTEENPQDVNIVFVLDLSASMDDVKDGTQNIEAAKTAAQALINNMKEKTAVNEKWKLVTFHTSASTVFNSWVDSDTMSRKINSYDEEDCYYGENTTNGGTNYEAALKKAGQEINTAPENAKKIVIFLTDGIPTAHGDSTLGGRTTTNKADYEGALKGAESIVCNRFYAIGMGLGTDKLSIEDYGEKTALDILQDVVGKVTAPDGKNAYNEKNSDLSNLFENIAGNIVEYIATNVTIIDTLSPEVDFVDAQGQTTTNPKDLKVLVKNSKGEDVTATEVRAGNITASYNAQTKQIRLDFADNYELKEGYNYSVTAKIKPNTKAIDKYKGNNYSYPDTGETGTGETSEGKEGIFSNVEDSAKVTWTTNNELKEGKYNRPVVQIPQKDIPIKLKKEPVNFFLNLSSAILDTDGNISGQLAEAFTTSVSGSFSESSGTQGCGVAINTDLRVVVPNDHDHNSLTGNGPYGVIGGQSDTNAKTVDEKIRQLGSQGGTNGNQSGTEDETYRIVDGNDQPKFPTDEEIFTYVRKNWKTEDGKGVNKGKDITVNGEAIDSNNLTTDNFTIRWYVFKDQSNREYWHIDGILVPKSGILTVKKTFPNVEITQKLNDTFKIQVTGNFLGASESSTIEKSLTDAQKVENADGTVTYEWSFAVFGNSYKVEELGYTLDSNSTWNYESTNWTYQPSSGQGSSGITTSAQVSTERTETDSTPKTQTLHFTNNYSTNNEDTSAYILVKKTFKGLSSKQISDLKDFSLTVTKKNDESFKKTLTIENRNSVTPDFVMSDEVKDYTFTWKVDGCTTGTYVIEENGQELDQYDVTTSVNAQEENKNEVTVTEGNWNFDPDVRDVTNNSSCALTISPDSIVMASLKAQNGYLIWTQEQLSEIQKAAIIWGINNLDELQTFRNHGGATKENTHFYYGDSLQNGITVSDGSVKYDPDKEELNFSGKSLWQHVAVGTYTMTSPQNADIAVVNTYNMKKTSIDLKKFGTTYNTTLDGAEFELYRGNKGETDEAVNWESDSIQKITIDNTDTIKELDLQEGYYKLKEVTAPSGYQLLGEDICFKIENRVVTLIDVAGSDLNSDETEMWKLEGDTTNGFVIKILNEAVYNLPSTGGPGIFVYTIGGTLLLMAAALLIYKMKREEVLKG